MTPGPQEAQTDFVTIATCAMPTEAHLLKQTLASAGVTAEIADAHFVQAYSWLGTAAGGVRVRVPAASAARAREVLAEFRAGALALEDDDAVVAAPEAVAGIEPPKAAEQGRHWFQIYRHASRTPSVVAVPQGFSWSAFLIGPLWFLLNGMWLPFVLSVSLIFGGPGFVRFISDTVGASGSVAGPLLAVALCAVWVLTGMIANFLLGDELRRKGYALGPRLQADSAGDAINAARV